MKKAIEKFDKLDMLGLLLDFHDQCRIAREIGIRFNPSGKNMKPDLILWCGMGGSAIGGDVIASYIKAKLKAPIIINRHYNIPSCVSRNTLVVISSYSGNTEETLSCYKQARAKKADILVITSGGKIEELAIKNRNMLIVIPQGLPPRCALGYSSIPAVIAFSKLGLIRLNIREIDEAADLMQKLSNRLNPEAARSGNISLKLAGELYRKYPLIYGSVDHFEPVAYRWRTQIAENAKALASHHHFAELNHNEIEAFEPFSRTPKNLVLIMLKDERDHARVKKRMNITRDIIKKKGVKVIEVNSSGRGLLARMFSVIYIGDWMSFYLAIMNKVDPTPVHRISYLKRRLGQ